MLSCFCSKPSKVPIVPRKALCGLPPPSVQPPALSLVSFFPPTGNCSSLSKPKPLLPRGLCTCCTCRPRCLKSPFAWLTPWPPPSVCSIVRFSPRLSLTTPLCKTTFPSLCSPSLFCFIFLRYTFHHLTFYRQSPIPPLSMGHMFRDPQQMPETMDNAEPYIYCFSPIHTYDKV